MKATPAQASKLVMKTKPIFDKALAKAAQMKGSGFLENVEKGLNKATGLAKTARSATRTAKSFGINTGNAAKYVDKFGNTLDTVRGVIHAGKRVRKTVKDLTGMGSCCSHK